MSRYEKPIDYGPYYSPDYESDVAAWQALNLFEPEVKPQPSKPEPAPEPLPVSTRAENRRKLDEYIAANPEGWAWIEQTERWRSREEEL